LGALPEAPPRQERGCSQRALPVAAAAGMHGGQRGVSERVSRCVWRREAAGRSASRPRSSPAAGRRVVLLAKAAPSGCGRGEAEPSAAQRRREEAAESGGRERRRRAVVRALSSV